MSGSFSASWLELREPHDLLARDLGLALQLTDILGIRPHLLDLGAGTGSLFRALAPVIGRAQVWTLVDSDRTLLDEAFAYTAEWAERLGWTVSFPGRAMVVHTPRGAWRMEALIADLADGPEFLPLARCDAVVCSALLDLVSRPWLEDLCAMLRTPFLGCLNVDGRDVFLPRHSADRLVTAGFRRDQSRDKGFGPALGRHAPSVAASLLRAHGFHITTAASDWRIPRLSLRMTMALVEGHASAASASLPSRSGAIDAWEDARIAQARRAKLAILIGHRDILALPPKSAKS